VGLGDREDYYPRQLPGGQKQRVAIARALVRKPKIILADEPTASLDRISGREVVELMQVLVRRQNCAILLVTHDYRILDIADRILTLEEGRVSSFESTVEGSSSRFLTTIFQLQRSGDLVRYVGGLANDKFRDLVQQVGQDLQWILETIELGSRETLQSLVFEILEAVAYKLKEFPRAGKASLFIVNPESSELYARFARTADGEGGRGILRLLEGGAESYLDFAMRHEQDYGEGRLLCMPVLDRKKNLMAILKMIKDPEDPSFSEADEKYFSEYAEALGLILETSLEIAHQNRGQARTD